MEDWQKLDQASLRQYQAGDISGYRATRSAMGDMARSLERDPQLESILANRKRELASRSNQAAASATNWLSPMASTSVEAGASEFDAVDGAHSSASKCHRVVALEQTTLRGAVHGRS